MTVALKRDQLLVDMAAARARVMQSIAGVDEEQASRPELDGWSVKDQLAHLTICDEIRFHEIGRISRGRKPGYANLLGGPMDSFNEIVVSLRRTLSLEQILEDLQAARSAVLQTIAAAPDRALSPELYGDYAVNGSINDDTEHAAAIKAWRGRENV